MRFSDEKSLLNPPSISLMPVYERLIELGGCRHALVVELVEWIDFQLESLLHLEVRALLLLSPLLVVNSV